MYNAEMRMLKWMDDHTRSDKIRNKDIRNKIGVASLVNKMREVRLRLFGHVKGRRVNAPIIRRLRGWLKRVLGEAEILQDLRAFSSVFLEMLDDVNLLEMLSISGNVGKCFVISSRSPGRTPLMTPSKSYVIDGVASSNCRMFVEEFEFS
ncbi:hypothetical protein H5410_041062 [Solanum commersonii]|uniref:Uncharacterized protein n=1 Tax=Solanum commersonii TaxID=4109 RepID=A0A9J5XTE4_SOLCO|nr:hypothetical protein H5410_041062 [Solanum commersonii]